MANSEIIGAGQDTAHRAPKNEYPAYWTHVAAVAPFGLTSRIRTCFLRTAA